ENTDAQLVALARSDDTHAFRLLIERYQVMAFSIARRYVGEEETARELVQEAFLQAFLSLDHLREAAHFKNWLYGITLNICRNWRRMHPNHVLSLDAQPAVFEHSFHPGLAADPQELVEEQELQQQVRTAISLLTPKNQAVAFLFYYEDMSIQEIASRLKISLSAVKNRLHKGRQQLQEQLQRLYPEIIYSTNGRRKKKIMLHLKLVNTLQHKQHFSHTITLILLDEQTQRIWSPRLTKIIQSQNQVHLALEEEAAITLPDTTSFLADMVHALKGKVEEVAIDAVYEDLLYARVRLSGQRGQHTIKARFDEALLLAIHEDSPIMVAETILDQQAINLAEYGETQQQQLATIEALAEQAPYQLQPRAQRPYNLDFSDGLRYWIHHGLPESGSYALDTEHPRTGKASLVLTFQKDLTPHVVLLAHKGFLANSYRGKRLRAIAYLKADGMQQPVFHLAVSGPFAPDIDPPGDHGRHASYSTSTEILHIEEAHTWTAHELVIDVPANAQTISFSLSMRGHGQGTIWLDGIQLETVDESVPLTGTSIDPPPLQPLNLDFSNGLEFWDKRGDTPWQYEHGIDHDLPSHAAYLKSIDAASDGSCILQQLIRGEKYWGKRVRLSANIKTAAVEPQANLFINQLFGTSTTETIKGTVAWSPYELILAVPEGAFGLSFGIALHGTGQIWLEGVHLQVIEDSPRNIHVSGEE
ncbi:MAG TPA: bifunctional nuclease domain-containing protein, partial [Ktedonobacteraceae bacterium]|nr:bifunctional nuclease domain-containing protein [Ktedonobacteraceae bacterium]